MIRLKNLSTTTYYFFKNPNKWENKPLLLSISFLTTQCFFFFSQLAITHLDYFQDLFPQKTKNKKKRVCDKKEVFFFK